MVPSISTLRKCVLFFFFHFKKELERAGHILVKEQDKSYSEKKIACGRSCYVLPALARYRGFIQTR